MEIMTIESNAYRLLVEKIEKITAYVEESRNREETERKRKEEAESPVTKGRKADPKWMTHKEVCEALDISHRTLQRYRDSGRIQFSKIGRNCLYRVSDIERALEAHSIDGTEEKPEGLRRQYLVRTGKSGNRQKKT